MSAKRLSGSFWVGLSLVLLAGLSSARAQSPALSFNEVARRAKEARESNRLPEAVRLYRQGVALHPKWDEGLWYLATLLYDADRFKEAREAFARFVALKPDAGPAWALRGLCDFRLRDYPAALDHITRGMQSGASANGELLRVAAYHQAVLLVRAGQFELAVGPLTDLARASPESVGLVDAIGLMLLRKARLPEEIQETERDLVRRAGRAGYLHLARKGEEAGLAFADLVAAYPREPCVHYAYGLFLLANDPNRGLQELRKETEIAPDSVYAYLDIAFELLRQNDAAGAKDPAMKAVALAPKLFAAQNALGRVLVELGELDQGIRALETAVALAPDSPEMYYALARGYSRSGRAADADKAREKFAELDRLRQERRSRAQPAMAAPPGERP